MFNYSFRVFPSTFTTSTSKITFSGNSPSKATSDRFKRKNPLSDPELLNAMECGKVGHSFSESVKHKKTLSDSILLNAMERSVPNLFSPSLGDLAEQRRY